MSSIAVLRTPTHTSPYLSNRHSSGDTFNFSPSFRSTPPRLFDPAMLTPSPTDSHIFYASRSSDHSTSPTSLFESPTLHQRRPSLPGGKRRHIQASPTPLFTATNLPLRTPAKEPSRAHYTLECSPAPPMPVFTLPSSPTVPTTGLKRKVATTSHTPGPKPTLTPLSTTKRDPSSFDRLAPLPRPNFTRRATFEGDSSLERQAGAMNNLRMTDLDSSDEEDAGNNMFLSGLEYTKPKVKEDEVISALSPGGHVNKRRARSRPVSLELSGGSITTNPTPSSPEIPHPLFAVVQSVQPDRPRQMERFTSSASLFFGPSIPQRPTPSRMPPATPSPSKRSSMVVDGEDPFSSNSPYVGDSSFSFSITSGSPSPRSKILPKKFKPRDSGVALSDDEDDFLSTFDAPRASTSVSTIQSDGLVTPMDPSASSGWPTMPMFSSMPRDVDDFIAKTLTAGSKEGAAAKKPPTTPVKRNRVVSLHPRPWASAVAQKTARLPSFKVPEIPRKSMPNTMLRSGCNSGSDYDIENSPSHARVPSKPLFGSKIADHKHRPTALLTRTSSIASNASDMSPESVPPTPIEFLSGVHPHIPPPRASMPSTAAKENVRLGADAGVMRTGRPQQRPTFVQHRHRASSARPSANRTEILHGHARYSTAEGAAPRTSELGRLERDFVEIDVIGRGEFGRVMKVRRKLGAPEEYYAIKKSKPIEGSRHRLRLLEEVDVLKHLRNASGPEGHANVLNYLDSWEQDSALFIQTELCALGNFDRFLTEYGQHFPRLEEARVWKIIVDLCEGLRFIHNHGIIHLDIKPANIFITDEGRFKIGDFGLAAVWPRPTNSSNDSRQVRFEREGDKGYIALEVLQMSVYGTAADIFSLGMTLLETAANIVVPGEGEAWHRLRHEDFQQVDGWEEYCSSTLVTFVKSMMRMDPAARISIDTACAHPVVQRARSWMEHAREDALVHGISVFSASPLAGVADGFLEEILAPIDIGPEADGDVSMEFEG